MRIIAILIIALITSVPKAFCQNKMHDLASGYLFSYLTVENGLSNNFVDGIYKDSRNFIWISTLGGGLIRHDGYDNLTLSTSSEFKLKSNYVRKVCEDNHQRLWIASERGIDVMDLNTYQEADLGIEGDLDMTPWTNPSITIVKDSRGSIWVSQPKSITRFDFDSKGKITKIHQLHPGIKVKGTITALYEYDGQMLAGIDSRVMKVTADSRGNLAVSPLSNAIKIACMQVKCLISKENELWIGTDNGLYRHNTINETTKAYFHNEDDPTSISQNLISDIQIADNGQLVIATLKGINFYNTLSDNFYIFNQFSDKGNEFRSINCDFVNTIFCDNRIIWIGTESGGVNKMIKPSLAVKNYQPSRNNPKSISPGAVNSVYVDNDGSVWAGCVEGGLNHKEREGNDFEIYTTRNGLAHNSVSCIQPLDSNTLIIGTWGGGISLFDKKTRRGIKNINLENDSVNTSFVGALIHDTINNGLWMGTNNGLYFYSMATGKIIHALPDSIHNQIKGCLGAIISYKGNLVMGTTIGVVKIALSSLNTEILSNDGMVPATIMLPENGDTEYRNKITCIVQHSDSTIYFGTNGYGMFIRQRNETKRNISTADGLPNGIVSQIIEDNNHELWMATANGLSLYNPETGRVTSFYKEEGLCDNHFFWNGFGKSRDGNTLYFGAMHGLVEIDIERSHQTPIANKVYLSTLSIDDKLVYPNSGGYIKHDISCESDIYIHESDRDIELEFSALNYSSPAMVEYQYRLLGYRDDWTQLAKQQRKAYFSNLPQGTYTFQVRCVSGSLDWSEPTEITIHVKGYFWKQWWFILLIICILAAIFQWINHNRMKYLREQNDILEGRVNRRTAALESKTEELSRQNDMLFSQNEEISRQKTQMEQMNSKIQELTIDKLAFFTNITHEFRTPLTLIIGPIERALKLSTNPKVIEQLNFVDHNSKHLLSLVNQLMDFRKVETDNMPISLQPGNFQTFLEDVLLPFRALCKEKDIKLNLYLHLCSPYIMFDREAMTKIITNLVGNASKYTPAGGHIHIYAATLPQSKRLYLSVSDSGKGIVKEDVEKVFNSFYQSKNTNTAGNPVPGTGIGLYLCKKLANLLGGDITAQNNKHHGACFRLMLPLIVQDDSPVAVSSFMSDVSDTDDDDESENTDGRMTVLIVEDNAEMRQYIRTVLSDDYSVLEASDGNNALTVLGSHMVDIIISDMMMPGMDGLELTKAIRANINFSHIPVIILTAKTSRDTQLESLHAGADDYIIKPFDETMLKAKISTLVENRQKQQKRFQSDMNVESLNIAEDSYDKKFMDKVMKIIKENYKDSEFEVNDLVTLMGVSKTLMNKKMQSLTQQSAGPFIRTYRLKVAHDLIIKNRITHNMNISEIAYEVGFNDPKYFTRCFTKQYNVTPSQVMEGEE